MKDTKKKLKIKKNTHIIVKLIYSPLRSESKIGRYFIGLCLRVFHFNLYDLHGYLDY